MIGNVSRKGSTILVNRPVSLAHQSSSLLGKPSSTSASTMNHAFQESDSVNDSTVPGTFLERPRQMRRKTTNRNKVDSSRSIIEMLEDGDKKDQQLVALRFFFESGMSEEKQLARNALLLFAFPSDNNNDTNNGNNNSSCNDAITVDDRTDDETTDAHSMAGNGNALDDDESNNSVLNEVM